MDAVEPEDPLKGISDKNLKYYEECFKMMFDKENMGEITADRIIEIMKEISDDKIDEGKIEDLVEEYSIRKPKV